jgi:hypothetical protein
MGGERKSGPFQFSDIRDVSLARRSAASLRSNRDRGVGRTRMSDVFISYKRENLAAVGLTDRLAWSSSVGGQLALEEGKQVGVDRR